MLHVLDGARTAKRWCGHHWADKISKQVRCCEDTGCRQRTDEQHEKPFHWWKSRISSVQACVAESLKLHRLYSGVSKRRVFGTIISGDWKVKARASCKVYQRPNQIPTLWTIATGENKAPAIKKPHAPSVKQVNKCWNHAATDTTSNTKPQIKLFIFPSFLFFFTAVSPIGKPTDGIINQKRIIKGCMTMHQCLAFFGQSLPITFTCEPLQRLNPFVHFATL